MTSEAFEVDLRRVEAILPRYVAAGPRYTSYPTAPTWQESYGPEDFREALGRAGKHSSEVLSVYVHVPFCRSLCHFCACNRVITRKAELPARYLNVIEREIAAVRKAMGGERTCIQHHWGGGTPTHLHPDQVRRLFHAVNDAFPVSPDAEISIEVDPRVTTQAHLDALRECGFNRISMGVQDFDDKVQEAIHRLQPVEQTATLTERSRRAGFRSVNFDLIYGLPFQTVESFSHTLDTLLALSPDRVALYSYAHVTWVAKQQRGFERTDLPDPLTKLRILGLAIRRFLAAGYVFIGLDHFARPEDDLVSALRNRTLRRNFMGYTTQAGTDLLAFGPSAISELQDCYAQSHRDLDTWDQAVAATGLATMRGHLLSEDDQDRRWIISRIMCHGELRAAEYAAERRGDFTARYAPELERLVPMIEDGLVERLPEGGLRVTPLGRFLVRNVAMIFDAYLADQQQTGRPLFSKTV